jgi:hypothetical protein
MIARCRAPRPKPRRRAVSRSLVLLAAAASLAASASTVPVAGVKKGEADPAIVDDALAKAGLDVLRTVRTRTASYFVTAPSLQAWDDALAPRIVEASRRDPRGLRAAMRELPSEFQVKDGDAMYARFDLPDDRGDGAVAAWLPDRIGGREAANFFDARVPNQGLFVSGGDVKKERDAGRDALNALYLPSRPRTLIEGRLPQLTPRDLPGEGRGDLVIFGGRGGSGDDGEDLREEFERFLDHGGVAGGPMRPFPGGEGTLRDLLVSARVNVQLPDAPDGWYKLLATEPRTWQWADQRVKHPDLLLAVAAPIVADTDGGSREVVFGLFATYSPMVLDPAAAVAWAGSDGREMLTAIHRGEIPFFRDGDDVFLLRSDVARWVRGEARIGGGTARPHSEAASQVTAWAEKYRLRGLERVSRGPLPMRMTAIPDDERRELVDASRAVRGRVYRDDLAAWARRFEPKLPVGDLAPSRDAAPQGGAYALAAALRAPEPIAYAALERASSSEPSPSSSTSPPTSPSTSPSTSTSPSSPSSSSSSSSPAKAPARRESVLADNGQSFDDVFKDVGSGSAGWESSESGSEPVATRSSLETGRMGSSPVGTRGGEVRSRLDVIELYTEGGGCRPGGTASTSLQFLLDGVGEDDVALRLEWDLLRGGRSVRPNAVDLRRGAGAQEVEFSVACPEDAGDAELSVKLSAATLGLSAIGSQPFSVRAASTRSYAALVMPPERKCIAQSVDLDDEDFSMSTTEGLSADDISTAVEGFQRETLRCVPAGRDIAGTVHLEITVGCNGRVTNAVVLDDGTGDPEFAACVADTMRYTPFPAHDRPDGAVFEQSLRFE